MRLPKVCAGAAWMLTRTREGVEPILGAMRLRKWPTIRVRTGRQQTNSVRPAMEPPAESSASQAVPFQGGGR